MNQIRVGTYVRVEQTRGQATTNPVTTVHAGKVTRDCEGTLRVDGVNVTRDSGGYFPTGVVVLAIGK